MASSTLIHADGKLSICKICLENLVDFTNVESLKNILRSIDRPFLIDSYEDSFISNPNKPFGEYMRRIGMKQNRELTWNESDLDDVKVQIENQPISNMEYEIDEDMRHYWGKSNQEWEILFLEEEKNKLFTSFECPDYGMEMILKEICFINLDIEKLRQEKNPSNQKSITTLIETRSKLMNDANMKPIQSTGAEANDQITFGTLIKKWENEKPVPRPLGDEMKKYIDTFMVGHLAKMEGLNNEVTSKYDEALSEYTINFNELNRDEEEFED